MSDTSTARNPFVPTLPDEEMELQALGRALQLSEGFSLLFVRCNQAQQRQRIVAELRKQAPDLTIQEIHFKEPIDYLLEELRQRIADPAPDAVFVSGLEYSMPIATEAYATRFVASLNANRDLFPSVVPCPMVLWVPEYVLTALLRGAPDFFSVRSGVYSFAATPAETVSLAESMTAGDEWAVANLSLAEKQERIATIQSLLQDYQSLPAAKRDRRAEARLLFHLGALYSMLGCWQKAIECFEQDLVICREYGNRVGEGATLNNLGMVYEVQGHWQEAIESYEQSLSIRREYGDRAGEGQTLNNLGVVHQIQGHWQEAIESYEQSLGIFREYGNQVGEGATLNNLGMVYEAQGRWNESTACYEQSLAISRKYGDRIGEGGTLYNLASLQVTQGDIPGALAFGRQAVAVLEMTEDKAMLEKVRRQVEKWEKQALAVIG